MAIQLGSAYGKVTLDSSGLKNGVKSGVSDLQNLQKAGVLLGTTMKNVGNTLTLALTLPIVALGGASIKAASDFEETKNKAVVVFGEMADSIVASSNKAAAARGGAGRYRFFNLHPSPGFFRPRARADDRHVG
jgi:hypothetical protein